RIDQLHIDMNLPAVAAHAAFQNMGDVQSLSDFPWLLGAAILHHAGAADDFQVGTRGQPGEDVVLNGIGEGASLFVAVEIGERKHGKASGRWGKRPVPNKQGERTEQYRA